MRFLKYILINFKRFATKSRKRGKKIALDILKTLKIEEDKLQELAS